MKIGTIIKIGIVIAIACAIFGAGTVKNTMYKGADMAVDGIQYGVGKIAQSDTFQNIQSEVKDSVSQHVGDLGNEIGSSITKSIGSIFGK